MLKDIKLMAIIRNVDPVYVEDIVAVLLEEGINSLELSLSEREKGFLCMERIQERFSEAEINLGAGTVTNKEEVDRLVSMGVRFILTPGYDDELVSYALDAGLEVMPGVLTPGEVQQALKRGIHLLKLFPADAFGLGYIKSLKGPFPQADFMAVGGVNEINLHEFLEAGFTGAAIGGNLVRQRATDQDLPAIREKARAYVRAISG